MVSEVLEYSAQVFYDNSAFNPREKASHVGLEQHEGE